MFERTIQLRPDDAAVLGWLGAVYLLEGRPEPAEPLFTKALSFGRVWLRHCSGWDARPSPRATTHGP